MAVDAATAKKIRFALYCAVSILHCMEILIMVMWFEAALALVDLISLRLDPVRRARRTAWALRWRLISPARAERIERDAQRFAARLQGWAHVRPRSPRPPAAITVRCGQVIKHFQQRRRARSSTASTSDGGPGGDDPPAQRLTSPSLPHPAPWPTWPGDGNFCSPPCSESPSHV